MWSRPTDDLRSKESGFLVLVGTCFEKGRYEMKHGRDSGL